MRKSLFLLSFCCAYTNLPTSVVGCETVQDVGRPDLATVGWVPLNTTNFRSMRANQMGSSFHQMYPNVQQN